MGRSLQVFAAVLLCGVSAFAGEVYIADSDGNLYAGDPATGNFSFIGNAGTTIAGGGFADIGFGAGGVLYGYDSNFSGNQDFYTINTSTGAATLVGNSGSAINSAGLADSHAGVMYAGGNGNIFTVNTTTGAATPVCTASCTGTPYGYLVSGDLEFVGSTLYLTSSDTVGTDTGTGGELWSVNTSTAAGTPLGETGYNAVWGLAWDTDNSTFYGFTFTGQEFTINPSNLSLDAPVSSNLGSLLGENESELLGAAFIASTPEPSSIGLGLLGVALLAAGIARQRKAAARA